MMKLIGKKSIFFLVAIFVFSHGSTAEIPYHMEKQTIEVKMYPAQSTAMIRSQVYLSAAEPVKELHLLLNRNVREVAVKINGNTVNFEMDQNSDFVYFLDETDSTFREEYKSAGELTIIPDTPFHGGEIEISYLLSATDSVNQAAFSREYIAYEVKGYIGTRGVFISPAFFWYPTLPDNLLHFDISIETPDTLQILTQGELMSEGIKDGRRFTRWVADYPASGLHLVGSRYMVKKSSYKDVDIYTYFFPESEELSDSYLQASHRYLEMYDQLIGEYPFSKFAVVENFFPTGYGMPSYTLLGSQVIRLPFIIYTSLGHEVAHNWWGNSVYVNYETGNWCEGLTTYYADHHYKEMKSQTEAAGYRRDLNRDFTVYVKDNKDFPLSSFKERTESASRAIGYGKSAMVFHQLRRLVGDSLFYEIFRDFYKNYRFKDAGWGDIELSAEKLFQSDLTWFFDQWVQRKGAPELKLVSASRDNQTLSFTLGQADKELYRLKVPVKIVYEDSTSELREVWLEKAEQNYSYTLNKTPVQMIVDPDYDVFRTLSRAEIPPTLAEIFAQEKSYVVLPDNCSEDRSEMYRKFAETFIEGEENMSVKSVAELTDAQLQNTSLYLLGTAGENSLVPKISWMEQDELEFSNHSILLNGQPVPEADDIAVMVGRTGNGNQNVCIIAAGTNGKTGRVANLLSHYGKYSYLVFRDGKNIIKDIYTVNKNPMSKNF